MFHKRKRALLTKSAYQSARNFRLKLQRNKFHQTIHRLKCDGCSHQSDGAEWGL